MLLLKSTLFTGLMMATVPIFVIFGQLFWPFNIHVRFWFLSGWAKLVLWMLKVLCNLRFEVSGKENIPSNNAIVFCKHQSMWETIALQSIFPTQLWVLKHELLRVPFFGWALTMLGSIGIDRTAGRKAILQIAEEGTERLKKGYWVIIFPEGTRVPPGEHKRFGIGGSVLAEQSGYPVVPVAHNAGEYWSRRSLIKKPGVIKVVIGTPIESKGKSAQEINDIAEKWITETVDGISTLNK